MLFNSDQKQIGMKNSILALMLIFLVAFPKAGFKVSDVPITFGYILIAAVCAVAGFGNLISGKYRKFPRGSVLAFVSTLPLQGVALPLVSMLSSSEVSFTVSFLVSFTLLPFAFFIVLTPQISQMQTDKFRRYFRACIRFVALYGIFLFFFLLITGKFIEVPYLTVNADDLGQLALKDIDRGNGVYKLISTYNNGNIYGVCILMLLPLYDILERRLLWRLLVRISLILTLSRTVWFGLVVYELIAAFYLRPFRRSTMFYITASLAAALASILYLLSSLNLDASFIFDSSLGGRADALRAANVRFIPYDTILFSSEIMYVSILDALGVAGLVCFMLAMLAPIALASVGRNRRDIHTRAIAVGMVMLLVCGLSDGPIIFIPVMAFFWGLASIAMCEIKFDLVFAEGSQTAET
jgi:hypothetical protein